MHCFARSFLDRLVSQQGALFVAVHVQVIADIALHFSLHAARQSEVGFVKVSSRKETPVEDVRKVTMIPVLGAISVFKGFQHSISSHLESFFCLL